MVGHEYVAVAGEVVDGVGRQVQRAVNDAAVVHQLRVAAVARVVFQHTLSAVRAVHVIRLEIVAQLQRVVQAARHDGDVVFLFLSGIVCRQCHALLLVGRRGEASGRHHVGIRCRPRDSFA